LSPGVGFFRLIRLRRSLRHSGNVFARAIARVF
jgi:hypothetical protein